MKSKVRYYFSGNNTSEGFVSYYEDILPQREAARIFCIKGGPGTGKSTFMRQIGRLYLSKGFSIDYLRCSSDPQSLDGIVIKELNVAIIDGTMPHITDPVNPGAVDEIINLGEFLKEEKLLKNKERIISLNEEIGETFKYAYIYLKCANIIYRQSCDIMKKYVNDDKISDLIMSLEFPMKKDSGGTRKKFFGSGITSEGIVNELSSTSKNLRDIYLIDLPDGYKISDHMKFLSQKILDRGYNVEELFCPMSPRSAPEHIISVDSSMAVFTCNRFHSIEVFDKDKIKEILTVDVAPLSCIDKLRVNELRKQFDYNIEHAVKIIKEAKTLHDELELYYNDSMDFKALEKLKRNITARIDKLID